METAKEWYYGKYIVGIDDETNGLYDWFEKMEDYAKEYHENKIKNLNLFDIINDNLKKQITRDLINDLKLKVSVSSSLENYEKHIEVEVTLSHNDVVITKAKDKCSTYNRYCH